MPANPAEDVLLPEPNRGCPIFASFAKVGGDAAEEIPPNAATRRPPKGFGKRPA
jgi:hypothetical protein